MSQIGSFGNGLSTLLTQHRTFLLIISFAFIIAASLWRWRPQERKPVATAVLLGILIVTCYVLSVVLDALEVNALSQILSEFSHFAGGVLVIRLFGLFLFRLILPIFRVSLLRILEDLAELAGYGAWVIIYLHSVGFNLSGIITTSAVMTAVLAFAMQDTLGNILGGLALQLDNSIKVGDWVKVDDVTGKVSEVRWRYTAIETRNWETIIIPNSALMKGKFSVLGRRSGQPLQLRRWIHFDVGYEHFAGKVIDIAQTAVRQGQIKNVAANPPANCLLMDFMPSASRYALRYWLTNIEADDVTDSEVRVRIYAALMRAGIHMPFPQQHIKLTQTDEKYEENKQRQVIATLVDSLSRLEIFKTLHADELAEVAARLVYTPFAQGDIIMRQGAIAHWLYIIISGAADVFLDLTDGGRRCIDTIQGECFLGEMGLMTGDPRSATVIAKTEVLAYRLDKASFKQILERRPEIAEEISQLLVQRRFKHENLQQQFDNEALKQMLAQQQDNFLQQIRSFFRLDIL